MRDELPGPVFFVVAGGAGGRPSGMLSPAVTMSVSCAHRPASSPGDVNVKTCKDRFVACMLLACLSIAAVGCGGSAKKASMPAKPDPRPTSGPTGMSTDGGQGGAGSTVPPPPPVSIE